MFPALLEKLQRQEDLSEAEAAAAMARMMDGDVPAAQVAGLLIALRQKGERPAEIVGFARTMRARAVPLATPRPDALDTCGTGGDGAGTFNISTVAAIVVASCGVPVAKHGNRSASSRCGSADVFEALGVDVTAGPAAAEACLAEAGLAFFFAPTYHPSMRHVAPIRRELGVRTAFNLLGPLTNPAGARRQVVGVPRPELTELVAKALGMLGSERAWVVHGADGLDEISTTGYTKVSEARGGSVRTFYVHPADAGLPKAAIADLAGGDAAGNARIARQILGGAKGPARDIVLLNAGAALLVAGAASSLGEGIAAAAAAIDRGAASGTLSTLIATSRQGSGADGARPAGAPPAAAPDGARA